jgi:hypothetical protein
MEENERLKGLVLINQGFANKFHDFFCVFDLGVIKCGRDKLRNPGVHSILALKFDRKDFFFDIFIVL